MYPGTPSEDTVPSEKISVIPPFHEFAADNQSVSDGYSRVTENAQPSHQSRASHQNEGVTSIEPTVTAGTSQRGQVRKMSRRMAESVDQGMHHLAHQSTLSETDEEQINRINYFETYTPVVTWFAIRLMIIFGIIFCWALRQVDFVMAYPQAPIKMDIYMELSRPRTGTPKITC
jgi:hypothetical protein